MFVLGSADHTGEARGDCGCLRDKDLIPTRTFLNLVQFKKAISGENPLKNENLCEKIK